MELSIEEYFKYHPPVTDERKAKHQAINDISLAFAKGTVSPQEFIEAIQENVADKTTQQMAIASVRLAVLLETEPTEEAILSWWRSIDNIPVDELFLYAVQQARMFSNQGITVDELSEIAELQRLKDEIQQNDYGAMKMPEDFIVIEHLIERNMTRINKNS